MRLTIYLQLAAALLFGGALLLHAGVLIRRRWAGGPPAYPADWSPEQVLAWERWRLVFGLVLIALWVWGAFCLGLLLGPSVALNTQWGSVLIMPLALTWFWFSMATPRYEKLTPKRLKVLRVAALAAAIFAFVIPIALVGDSYFAPPWGSNVSVRAP